MWSGFIFTFGFVFLRTFEQVPTQWKNNTTGHWILHLVTCMCAHSTCGWRLLYHINLWKQRWWSKVMWIAVAPVQCRMAYYLTQLLTLCLPCSVTGHCTGLVDGNHPTHTDLDLLGIRGEGTHTQRAQPLARALPQHSSNTPRALWSWFAHNVRFWGEGPPICLLPVQLPPPATWPLAQNAGEYSLMYLLPHKLAFSSPVFYWRWMCPRHRIFMPGTHAGYITILPFSCML